MTHVFDPRRLADLDRAGQPDLGPAIRALRNEAASTSEIESLARRLAPQLSAPAGAGASGAALGMGANVKWISGVLCVAAAIGLYAWMQRGASGAAVQPRALVASPAARKDEPLSLPPPAAPRVLEIAEQVEVEPAIPVAPTKHRRSSPTAPRAEPAAAHVAPEAELTLLQRAQATLDRDASSALALAEQHARSYPQGLFAQEREVLAIEALLKLRRRPAALARAAEFVHRYPDSPHARRVRALLERAPLAPQSTIAPGSDHSSSDGH